jgi:hypothetical protein
VEGRRDDHGAEQPEEQHRVVERAAQAAGDAVREEEPGVEGEQRRQQHGEHRGREQPAEPASDPLHRALRHQRAAVPEGQQRVELAQRRARAVGRRHEPQRAQLALDEELDVVRADRAAEAPADVLRHGRLVTTAVGRLGHEVQQPAELDDLAVGAPREVRRLLEARALELAEELHSLGESRGRGLSRRRLGGRVGRGHADGPFRRPGRARP